MKVFTILAALALAATTSAQAPTLPDCAKSCADTFLGSGAGDCGTDAKCICSNNKFLGEIACCLAQPGGCNPAEQTQAVAFASNICAAAGVTVPASVVCATATSTTPAPTGTAATNGTFTTPPPGAGSGSSSSSSSQGWAPRQTVGPVAGVLGGLVAAVALL